MRQSRIQGIGLSEASYNGGADGSVVAGVVDPGPGTIARRGYPMRQSRIQMHRPNRGRLQRSQLQRSCAAPAGGPRGGALAGLAGPLLDALARVVGRLQEPQLLGQGKPQIEKARDGTALRRRRGGRSVLGCFAHAAHGPERPTVVRDHAVESQSEIPWHSPGHFARFACAFRAAVRSGKNGGRSGFGGGRPLARHFTALAPWTLVGIE